MTKFGNTTREALVDMGDAFYYFVLARELRDSKTVLDLGCGALSPLRKIKGTYHSVGVDVFPSSMRESKRRKIHDEYIFSYVLEVSKVLGNRKFDTVLALDLIEHLDRKKESRLLRLMESLALHKVILLTSNGFMKQDPYGDNPYQVHRSGWTSSDFSRRGYDVYVMRGLKWLRGEYATIRWKPWFLWSLDSVTTQFPLYFFLEYSNQLLAVKKLRISRI